MRLGEALAGGRRQLAGLPSAQLEAEILLAFCLDAPRASLYANPEQDLTEEQSTRYRELLRRRLAGEPVAYLTGRREFWSLPLRVTPDVLIPRPETERLVELALRLIPADTAWRVADIGTGSGAIALAIASERPRAQLHATDISAAALAVAQANAANLSVGNVAFHRGSFCRPLPGSFDLILSNPPYVAEDDPHLQRGDCRFEPRSALTPGADPLAAIRRIAAQAGEKLKAGGWLLLEHGPDQGEAVRTLLRGMGYREIATWQDLLGHDRVTQGRHAGRPRAAQSDSAA